MFDEKKITIYQNNRKICTVLVQIYSMPVKLPIDKFNKEIEIDNWLANKACQELLNQKKIL